MRNQLGSEPVWYTDNVMMFLPLPLLFGPVASNLVLKKYPRVDFANGATDESSLNKRR